MALGMAAEEDHRGMEQEGTTRSPREHRENTRVGTYSIHTKATANLKCFFFIYDLQLWVKGF